MKGRHIMLAGVRTAGNQFLSSVSKANQNNVAVNYFY